MARERAVFSVSVGGEDVTRAFTPRVTSISVTENSGSTADTASITLDDKDGSLSLPSIGDKISVGLGWGRAVEIFQGAIDNIESTGSRGGLYLTISATSADHTKTKVKGRHHKHKDDATLGDVAQEWGSASGLDGVHVHESLSSIQRAYWGMHNESFPSWAMRTAQQYGATFKILGNRGVMVPRSGGASASGKDLGAVKAVRPGNLMSWNIRPKIGRPQHAKFKAKHFDIPKAEWKWKDEEPSYDTDAEAEHTATFAEPDEDTASSRAESNMKESDRDRGTGTVTIDGEPLAQAEAPCTVSGARPGVDGTYRIDSVTHTYSRGGGWTTDLSLKQPTGEAGKDTRQSSKASDDGDATTAPTTADDLPDGAAPIGQGGIGHPQ